MNSITITITIGGKFSSKQSFQDASDEWVWMRIHELRQCRLEAPFCIAIQTPRASFELTTPLGAERLVGEFDSFEQQVVDIWMRMGMQSPDYTAGSAVFFIQRLRLLLNREKALLSEQELTGL